MVVPGAPVIVGPVHDCTPVLRLDGVLAGARVTVSGDDGSFFADDVASQNGTAWLPVIRPLADGMTLAAEQEFNGEVSPASPKRVRVDAAPKVLPRAAFAVVLNPCSKTVLLTGLLPGAEVFLRYGAQSISVGIVYRSRQWVDLPFGQQLATGDVIYVMQRLAGRPDSDETPSEPVADSPDRDGKPPFVWEAWACSHELTIENAIPTALIHVEHDDGTWMEFNAPAATFTGNHNQRLVKGTLRARQTLSGCEYESGERDSVVHPESGLAAPRPQPFCPESQGIAVDGLKRGSTVEFSARINGIDTPLMICGASGEPTQWFDLPAVVGGTGPLAQIVAIQHGCTLSSSQGIADEVSRQAVQPQPKIDQIFPCQDELVLYSGAGLATVYSDWLGQPVSAEFWAGPFAGDSTAALPVRVRLNPPAIAGDTLTVRFTGCNAPSQVARQVENLARVPEPKIATPLPGDYRLNVTGEAYGTVVAVVNGRTLAQAKPNPITRSCTIELGKQLNEGDRFWVYQRVCGETSNRDGARTVERGTLNVELSRTQFVVNQLTHLTVTAHNTENGELVWNLPVILDGQRMSVTGSEFQFTPLLDQVTVNGHVEGGTRFHDAQFSIVVGQPKPASVPDPTFGLRITGAQDSSVRVRVNKSTWTLQPSWSPNPVTLETQLLVGSAQLPPIPPGTSNPIVTVYQPTLDAVYGDDAWGTIALLPEIWPYPVTIDPADQNWTLVFQMSPQVVVHEVLNEHGWAVSAYATTLVVFHHKE